MVVQRLERLDRDVLECISCCFSRNVLLSGLCGVIWSDATGKAGSEAMDMQEALCKIMKFLLKWLSMVASTKCGVGEVPILDAFHKAILIRTCSPKQ